MKKILTIIILLIAIVMAIVPHYLGGKVASGFKDYLHSQDIVGLRQYGITLTLKDYQRGYFTSQASTQLTIVHPQDGRLLLSTTLDHNITHAPLSLSGFNWLTIDVVNSPSLVGELSDTLPMQFITAQNRVNLLGYVTQFIDFSPMFLTGDFLPIERLDVDGLSMTWVSHLQDFPTFGHGELDSGEVVIKHLSRASTTIPNLHAGLTITEQDKTLRLTDLSIDHQFAEKQTIHTHFTRLEQLIALKNQGVQAMPLSHDLVIEGFDMTFNAKPQMSIDDWQVSYGLTETATHYDFILNWTADVFIEPDADRAQFPWLASLPTEQAFKLTLSPIDKQQFSAWSQLIDSVAHPSSSRPQVFSQLGQLIRFNIINEHMLLKLAAEFSRNDSSLALFDIFIDENLDDAQQINTLIREGLDSYRFNDSYAHIKLRRDWLKDLKLLPMLLIFAGEWFNVDDQDYLTLTAEINDHQIILNDEVLSQ